MRRGAEWRCFRHAPCMQHAQIVLIECTDHGFGSRCAAHHHAHARRQGPLRRIFFESLQYPHPDGRHAGAHGHLFCFHQFIERRAVQLWPRQHQLGAGDQRRIGDAPGVDVKHRHHRQYRFLRREAQRAGDADGDRIEHDGAVRVQRALRVASGARGVAQRRAGALIKTRPGERFAGRGDQVFVVEYIGHALDGRCVGGIGQADPVAHLGTMRRNALDERREGGIEDHRLVFGMVDDVDQLLRVQARVAGVHHHAAAGHGVVGLEVAVVVPGDRGDHAAGAEAQAGQRVGELFGAHRALRGGVAEQRAVGLARDDFGVAVLRRRMFEDAGKQKRHVHHQAGLQHVACLLWF